MDEQDWIRLLTERLGTEAARVEVGIGDDAAVLAPSRRRTVVSVDAAVEGVHFERAWLDAEDIGFRSYVAALSDLAAMGARARAGLVSLIARSDEAEAALDAVFTGLAEAALAYDAPVIGGNLSRGPALVLSTTVLGDAGPRLLTRGGARVGDAVFVTGTVGGAALGWRVLRAGGPEDEAEAAAVARWRRPRARFDVLERLRGVATAAIDVSDGVAQDLGHLCAASGVGARLEIARLPTEPGFSAAAARRGEDPVRLALAGGEDYELLFTAPPDAVEGGWATRIGDVLAGTSVTVRDRDGRDAPAPTGYRHRVAGQR